jgi:hypothetical protein
MSAREKAEASLTHVAGNPLRGIGWALLDVADALRDQRVYVEPSYREIDLESTDEIPDEETERG